MIFVPLTILAITFIFAITTFAMMCSIMWMRLVRTHDLESKVARTMDVIDTAQLKIYLQNLTLTAVEIDDEVAKLKQDIIAAAHKHHLTVDEKSTQPDSPFGNKEKSGNVIKLVDKRQTDMATRVG